MNEFADNPRTFTLTSAWNSTKLPDEVPVPGEKVLSTFGFHADQVRVVAADPFKHSHHPLLSIYKKRCRLIMPPSVSKRRLSPPTSDRVKHRVCTGYSMNKQSHHQRLTRCRIKKNNHACLNHLSQAAIFNSSANKPTNQPMNECVPGTL